MESPDVPLTSSPVVSPEARARPEKGRQQGRSLQPAIEERRSNENFLKRALQSMILSLSLSLSNMNGFEGSDSVDCSSVDKEGNMNKLKPWWGIFLAGL